MNNVIDSIKLSGTVYTLSAQTEGGGVPESAFTAYTASTNERISQDEEVTAAALNVLNESLSGKQDTLSAGTNITISGNVISTSGVVTVVDNEVAPFYAESSAQYEGYYPAQGTDLSYADAYSSVKVMQRSCGFWVRLDITAKLVNESGETITESFRVNNYITSGSAHINVTVLDTTQHFYKLTATDGYRFANVYNFSRVDDGGCYGYIKVYDTFMAGGQSKDVIENVIEPMFAKKQDNLKAGNNIKIDSSNTISVSPTQQIYGYNSYSAYTPSSKAVYNFVAAHSGSSITVDTELDSGSTNPVQNKVIYNKIDEVEQVTAAALNVLNESLSGKQDTLSAGTNITISGNVISAEGGGKAIEAGRGISITTGATADTVSFNLPISAGTGTNSIVEGNTNNKASGSSSHAEGEYTKANGYTSHAEGGSTKANGSYSHAEGQGTTASGNYGAHAEGSTTTASGESSHAEGLYTKANGNGAHAEGSTTTANGKYSHAEGTRTIANNQSEHASGQYNVSSSASTTFGDSGNTLFSVGNGADNFTKHNAFEIRQNGDIYINYDSADIILQDKLGEIEEVTASGLNALNDKFGGLKLMKITQAAYDALPTKDPNTLYIIID